jgi:hypothetical protein
MKLFINDGFGPKTCDLAKKERARGKIMKFNWNYQVVMFQGLVVFKA